MIDGFWFRFENGKVVDFGAKQEEETLKSLLDFDEGSRHLGEVALVPYDSPISNSNILFFNTCLLYTSFVRMRLRLNLLVSIPRSIKLLRSYTLHSLRV